MNMAGKRCISLSEREIQIIAYALRNYKANWSEEDEDNDMDYDLMDEVSSKFDAL
jgi:hypothetical protein